MTPNQMGERDKERVNEGARAVSQNDGLLLCEREVYSLRDPVGEKNEATVPYVVKSRGPRMDVCYSQSKVHIFGRDTRQGVARRTSEFPYSPRNWRPIKWVENCTRTELRWLSDRRDLLECCDGDKRQLSWRLRLDRLRFSVDAFDDFPTVPTFGATGEPTITLLEYLSTYSHPPRGPVRTFFFRLRTKKTPIIMNVSEAINGDSPAPIACSTSWQCPSVHLFRKLDLTRRLPCRPITDLGFSNIVEIRTGQNITRDVGRTTKPRTLL